MSLPTNLMQMFTPQRDEEPAEEKRDIESIKNAICVAITATKPISGKTDALFGLCRVIEHKVRDAAFNQALEDIAKTVLLLFPNKDEMREAQ